jgi:nucleoid DNA-binding protein
METPKRMSKTQILTELAERTGLGKKEVQNVFDALGALCARELGAQGPGELILPDLVKLKVKITPAREAHRGIDPFTKQERDFPAKPASRKVRATPVKKLKDLVA